MLHRFGAQSYPVFFHIMCKSRETCSKAATAHRCPAKLRPQAGRETGTHATQRSNTTCALPAMRPIIHVEEACRRRFELEP